MNNNHKVLRIIRLEEQEVQTKKLSPSFISLGLKIFLSFLAAVMFSFLFQMSHFIVVLGNDLATYIPSIIIASLISSLIFILMLTLIIVLFAFYKMDGIHEGWTLDRATRTEKSIIWLWIFLVVLALCLILLIFVEVSTDYMLEIVMLSMPLTFILFLVFFAFIANIGKTYRSKIEELILKENKDESTEKNTKRIKIIRLEERETQKEILSPSFISLCVKILFFSLVATVLTFLFRKYTFERGIGNLGWLAALFEALTFTLILTLMMLSIAFYKVDGIHEGWIVDRATGMEKVVIILWILSLGVGIYLISGFLVPRFYDYLYFWMVSYPASSMPSTFTLFIILFASIIKTAKAYRSRIEELIIPEGKNE